MFALLFLFLIQTTQGAFTLKEAERYARNTMEYPPLDNKNIVLTPDYTNWYQTHTPTFIDKILNKFSLKKLDWTISEFETLLQDQVRSREKRGLAIDHAFVLRPDAGSQFAIIGPLFGSFHSFVRILVDLRKKGFLSEELRVTKSNCYLVILGNAFNGTPYNLETFTLILSLMRTNPDQVFYIAGTHDHPHTWQAYGLKTELNHREENPLIEDKISSFFATLPQELFIESGSGRVRIGTPIQEFNEKVCAKKEGVCVLSTTSPHQLSVQAIIEAEKRVMSYQEHPGLLLLPSEGSALIWSVFSAPNSIYKEFFHFHYDAYCMINLSKRLEASSLTLYHQDVREQVGFKKTAVYGLISGVSLLPSRVLQGNPLLPTPELEKKWEECSAVSDVDRAEKAASRKELEAVYIGCSLDLSKGASAQGKPVKEGISLYIAHYNQKGGYKGRPVKIVFMDDEYSPEKARINVEEFMKKYKSTLFLCNLGSPTVQAYLELIRQGKLFLFFPITGAPIFRQPDLPTIVHWRASYPTEARALTQYIIDTARITDFAFLYQDDSYGKGGLEGSRKVLQKAGITTFKEVPYERNTTNFTTQVATIKAAMVKAIGFFSTSIVATEFIRQAGVEFFIGKKLFALSDLSEESFKKFIHQKGLDLIVAESTPNPVTSKLEIVKEYRSILHRQGYSVEDAFALEGFIAASLMMMILEKSPDLSNEAIVKTITAMKDGGSYKGLKLNFNPQTRELVHMLWLDTGAPDWIQQKLGVNE